MCCKKKTSGFPLGGIPPASILDCSMVICIHQEFARRLKYLQTEGLIRSTFPHIFFQVFDEYHESTCSVKRAKMHAVWRNGGSFMRNSM